MSRTVTLPPPAESPFAGDLGALGGWWHDDEQTGRMVCDLCPRACSLKPGDRGFCFVRENRDGQMVLTTYGRSTGFCIDPIEKKPLNHFYPGSSVLSFGTAGCNLGCKFCQNHDISKAREVELLSQQALPETIAAAAEQLGCQSVAYTYNDPVIWAEYAIDTAKACRQRGIKSVAVTAGYITPQARGPFFEFFDAANVDLKAFSEEFYQQLTLSHLRPVLETLKWLKQETDVWFEITNLLIPTANDKMDEVREMCDWLLEHVGDEVPVHFTAFHPDFKMTDLPRTPVETLLEAQAVAQQAGLKYTYVGNVDDGEHQSTYCGSCHRLLIERNWYELGAYHLNGSYCEYCAAKIPGHFADRPGDWGRRREPVDISRFSQTRISSPRDEPSVIPPEDIRMPHEAAAATGTSPATLIDLSDEQMQAIHQVASEIVCATVQNREPQLNTAALQGVASISMLGAFISLKRAGKLRACCGFLGKETDLFSALHLAGIRTAREDVRLPPISVSELPYLQLETWLLYGMMLITAPGESRSDQVEIGRHGLKIVGGGQSGLLLPGVAVERGFTPEQFLEAVCLKASLPVEAWKSPECQLYRFEGKSLQLPMDPMAVARGHTATGPLCSDEDLAALQRFCQTTVIHDFAGAATNYYVAGVADGMVQAVAIALPTRGLNFSQISLRPGLPLQSSLYTMSGHVARYLQTQAMTVDQVSALPVEIMFGYDSAMHGTLAAPELQGLNCLDRSIVVVEGNRSAWLFSPDLSAAKELLAKATVELNVGNSAAAQVYSLRTQSTAPRMSIVKVPIAASGLADRPPAVAGRFYADDPVRLAREVDRLMPTDCPEQRPYPAAMVPHAGLRYSGKIAAATLAAIELPPTVMILSPKHTRQGVSFAVAPNATWSLPGMQLKSDVELARAVAARIPQWELDAAAHQAEHGIEVELPLLHRLAPKSKIVGIALGAANWEQCQQFAGGLAELLEEWPTRVLLLISSDMNHFATDEENRRLDALAIEALKSLSGQQVLETCQRHQISMCGQVPAAVVLETLRKLGKLTRAEQVAYATSADVSGDQERVVGYCGMLFD